MFGDQIACADIVLLTKPDLAGPEGVAKAREAVLAEAPRAIPVIEVAEGAIDPRIVLGLEAAAEDDLDARPSHHGDEPHDHDHDDFESIVVDLPEQADPATLVAAIERLARERGILRVKGYAAVAGKPMRLLVQAVGARVRHQYDRPWRPEEARAGRLVVIAEHDDIDAAAIRATLGADAGPGRRVAVHVVFREQHGLDDAGTPVDLAQDPAELVVLSFSDSDLGAFAEGWRAGGGPEGRLPGLRLANLSQLRHPLSVDTYLERTLSGARGILIRLIGGVPYWPYGLRRVLSLAQERGIALAVIPADRRPDPRLDAHSTVPASTLARLRALCETGGAVAAQAALAQLALSAGLYAGPVRGGEGPAPGRRLDARARPVVPARRSRRGAVSRAAGSSSSSTAPIWPRRTSPRSARSWAAFEAKGCHVRALFAPSLKAPDPAAWLARQVRAYAPHAIVNATSFSGRGADGASPLDAGGVPVFQVALATFDPSRLGRGRAGPLARRSRHARRPAGGGRPTDRRRRLLQGAGRAGRGAPVRPHGARSGPPPGSTRSLAA